MGIRVLQWSMVGYISLAWTRGRCVTSANEEIILRRKIFPGIINFSQIQFKLFIYLWMLTFDTTISPFDFSILNVEYDVLVL